MNIFSVVVILILLYWIIKYRGIKKIWINILSMCCALEIYQISGSFLRINESISISYIEFFMIVLTILSFIYTFRTKLLIDKIFKYEIMLLMVIAIGILYACVLPYEKDVISFGMSWDSYVSGFIAKKPIRISIRSVFLLIKVFCFCQVLYVSNRMFDHDDVVDVLKGIVDYGKIVVIYGLFEIIVKLAGSDFTIKMNIFIFGSYDGGFTALRMNRNLLRMQGFSSEPSYYAMGLFFFLIICFILKNYVEINVKWSYLAMFLLLVSSSFSSLIYIAVYVLIVVMQSKKIDKKKLIVSGVALSACIIFILLNNNLSSYFFSRMNNFFVVSRRILDGHWKGLPFSSELSRMLSIYDTFHVFLDRWIFGCGLGTATCFSGLVTVLADIGVLGFYYYTKLVMHNVSKRKKLVLGIIIFIPNIMIGTIAMMYTLIYIPIKMLIGEDHNDKHNKEKSTTYI